MTRFVTSQDVQGLKTVLDNCDLFPSSYLDDMIADYLTNTESTAIWFTTEVNEQLVSIGYCAPMQMTNNTYNLYAIGVKDTHQRKGTGSEMITFLESYLKRIGARLLIIETSTSDDQRHARAFYAKRGYDRVATIPSFWDEGDGKVVFTKKLR